MLYPLSYEGDGHQATCQRLPTGARERRRAPTVPTPTGEHTPITRTPTRSGPTRTVAHCRRPSPTSANSH